MRGLSQIVIASAFLALGCDNRPAVPPTAPDKPAQPTPAVPTTQELIDAPRTPLDLKIMPIRLQTPKGWKIDTSSAQLVSLLGSAPSGDVEINISTEGVIDTKRMEATVAGAKATMAKDPAHINISDLRDMNGMKIYERIETPPATTRPATMLSDDGTPREIPQFISWLIVIFVPQGNNAYLPCDFNFIGLSTQQFASDQAFLRNVIQTATYDETARVH